MPGRRRPVSAIVQQLPPLIAIALGPDTVTPGGKDSRGIQAVFHAFVEAEQCLIIPRVGVRDLVRQQNMGPVFAIAGSSTLIDQLPDRRDGSTLIVLTAPIVDDIHDQMHLPRGDAERRKEIESVFLMDAQGDTKDLQDVCALRRADRREEEMRAVPPPIQPLQFPDVRDSRAHIHARVEVMVRRHVSRE